VENDSGSAPGFNTKNGRYIGYGFIAFGLGGLNSKVVIKIISGASSKGTY